MSDTTNGPLRAAVIGGGPGGLMAAEILAKGGADVVVFEAMTSVGRKFLLAGRGGLNITHSEDLNQLLKRYDYATSPGSASIDTAIRAFGPEDVSNWCESLDQKTFVGSSGRVFPADFRANKLYRAWLTRLGELGVDIRTLHRWTGFGSTHGSLRFLDSDGSELAHECDVTVIALGGASWPRLGSDGNWTEMLAEQGCVVSELVASNCGFKIPWTERFAERFAGVPVKNISLTIGDHSARGEMMVVDDGIEGGAVYAVGHSVRTLFARDGSAELFVDLQPDLDHAALVARISKRRPKDSMSKTLKKSVGLDAVKAGLIQEVTAGSPPRNAEDLAVLVKAVPLTVVESQGLDRAISSAGGLTLGELDENFMLKRRPGTFCAGEMLDWDAPTGGYLLQATFSTAVAAAKGALSWWKKTSPIEKSDNRSGSTVRSAPLGPEHDEL